MSQKAAILEALRDGQRITPLNALIRFHCLSLSQRVGQLRREGHLILDTWLTVNSRKRVKEYFMPLGSNTLRERGMGNES